MKIFYEDIFISMFNPSS